MAGFQGNVPVDALRISTRQEQVLSALRGGSGALASSMHSRFLLLGACESRSPNAAVPRRPWRRGATHCPRIAICRRRRVPSSAPNRVVIEMRRPPPRRRTHVPARNPQTQNASSRRPGDHGAACSRRNRARSAAHAAPAAPTGRHATGDPAMDLILPDHLREPGHRVPRDDPPHDSRPIAPATSAAGVPPAVASIHRTARRAPVCGLRDWRSAARGSAAIGASPSTANPSLGLGCTRIKAPPTAAGPSAQGSAPMETALP